jgi:signal transduction histidine kinase
MGKINNPAYVDYAGDINDSAKHLLETLTLILDISKVETEHSALIEEEFDLAETISKARNRFTRMAYEKNIVLEDHEAGELIFVGDEARMARAFNCIVDNAVKFSPPRTTVRMGIRVSPEHVELWVHDEGIGMSEVDLPQAFRLFSQLDEATARRFSGMGIGLAYTKTMIEAHGGKIVMDTKLNAGTAVTLSLPLSRLSKIPVEMDAAPSRMTG